MPNYFSIKLKALFLLVVFATNTAVGFACALSINVGFNESHRSEIEEVAVVHIHDQGKKHVHENGIAQQTERESARQIPVAGSKLLTNEDGGCCTNEVQVFQHLDKNVTLNTSLHAPVFVAILRTFLDVDYSTAIYDFPIIYKVRFYYPPPPNLRIAIQRFQI